MDARSPRRLCAQARASLSAVRDYYKGEGEEEILRPDKEGAG
jgi:hypothetical protein